MKKIKAIWDLMRLEHGVMIIIAILVGSLIALKGEALPPLKNLVLAFLAALFIEASTFALNDYYDLDIDKKNKRNDRPLVRGDVTPKTALYLFYILFPIGIICSFFVNITCFTIALVTALLALIYDVRLKKTKLVGNFYIAYAMAIPFVFGGAAVIEKNVFTLAIDPVIYVVASIAFLAGSGREIMKDVMDFAGDEEKGVRSFPSYIGVRKSNILAAFFYIVAVALSLLPFFLSIYEIYYLNYYYLFPVLITDIMLLSTSFQLIFKKKILQIHLKIYRKSTLVAIFIGLLAFLSGAFLPNYF